MIALGLFMYVGIRLNAPWWYWALCALSAVISILKFGVDMYKAGKE